MLQHQILKTTIVRVRVMRSKGWMHLNDTYCDLYRAHRDAEDRASQAKWAAE